MSLHSTHQVGTWFIWQNSISKNGDCPCRGQLL